MTKTDSRIALAFLMFAMLPAAWSQGTAADLDHVLTQMDSNAKNFRSAEASFVWDQYQKVIDETDTQKGKIYFRRQGNDTQMAADITEPDKKYVIYSGGRVQVYQPKIDQVNEYNAGKNKSDLESFLVLGFGGSGHDMQKMYEVKYLGAESINGISTSKLELVPKSTHLRNNVSKIVLWIDPGRGVSVQQQFFQPDGDYRLAKYSDIQVNQKIADNAFKLKTTGKTKVISPQG